MYSTQQFSLQHIAFLSVWLEDGAKHQRTLTSIKRMRYLGAALRAILVRWKLMLVVWGSPK